MLQYSSPTFLFREICPEQLPAIMKELAKAGFDGLELYGMFGYNSNDIISMCNATNMKIVCDHIRYKAFSENTSEVIRSRKALGIKYLTIDQIPAELLPGQPGFEIAVHEINRIGKECKANGIQLLYHNHGYDLTHKVNGTPILDIILDRFDPELLKFQPDLGWLQLGGADAAHYLEKYKDRCPVIHLKDYFSTAPIRMESPFVLGSKRGGPDYNHFEFRPSGYGVMNFPKLMPQILNCKPEWLTTDHDLSYERNTYTDMKMSLRYIKDLVALY